MEFKQTTWTKSVRVHANRIWRRKPDAEPGTTDVCSCEAVKDLRRGHFYNVQFYLELLDNVRWLAGPIFSYFLCIDDVVKSRCRL